MRGFVVGCAVAAGLALFIYVATQPGDTPASIALAGVAGAFVGLASGILLFCRRNS